MSGLKTTPKSLQSIFETEPEEPERVIGSGLLNKGSLLCIAGPPKTYKSFALATMLVELACGLPIWMIESRRRSQMIFPVFKPQRVLLLEQEMGLANLKTRYSSILKTIPDNMKALCLSNISVISCDYNMLLDRPSGCKVISEYIDSSPVDVLAMDPFSRFFIKGENEADAMNTIIYNLNSIRFPRQLSTILIHHTPKPSGVVREGLDLLRGHSMLAGAIDSAVLVSRYAAGVIKLDFVFRHDVPVPPAFVKIDSGTLRSSFVCWRYDPDWKQKVGRAEQNSDVDEPSAFIM